MKSDDASCHKCLKCYRVHSPKKKKVLHYALPHFIQKMNKLSLTLPRLLVQVIKKGGSWVLINSFLIWAHEISHLVVHIGKYLVILLECASNIPWFGLFAHIISYLGFMYASKQA